MNGRLEHLLAHLGRAVFPKPPPDDRHCRALSWEATDRPPLIVTHPPDADGPFAPFPHRETFADPGKMLFNELTSAFGICLARAHETAADQPFTARANFGTVLVASLFGADVRQVDDNPPWVVHGQGADVTLEAVAAHDPQDFSRGWLARVEDTYAAYRQLLEAYPEIRRVLRLVLPDMQGPFDNLELIVGSGVFESLILDEALTGRALAVLAETQIALARRLAPLLDDGPDGFSHQHGTTICGNVLLRNDSVIMMSGDMYRAQIAPHDARVLHALGGGGIHCCGNVERIFPAFLDVPGLSCFDFGQSELNDVDALYRMAAERRIPLIRVTATEEELVSGRARERFPTGVSFIHRAASREDAARVAEAYRTGSDFRAEPQRTQR